MSIANFSLSLVSNDGLKYVGNVQTKDVKNLNKTF